jgi:type II secretory pathway component GspD/PulD (secretin)
MEKMVSRVIKLKTANAVTSIGAHQPFPATRPSRGRSTRNQAIVSYEPYSGTILLFGPEEDVTQIEGIVKDLDKVELAGREPEIINLKNAQASQVSSVLQQILTSMSPSQTPPIVVAESRINALIVSAREEVMPKVRDWIATRRFRQRRT